MDSRGFIRRLQMAMYKWAKGRKYATVRSFDKGELEKRPDEETRREMGGEPMEHPEEMLPTVPALVASLRKEMGDPCASERKIKTQFTNLTTQVNREANEAGRSGTLDCKGKHWDGPQTPRGTSGAPYSSNGPRWKMSRWTAQFS